jgi:hypothetical protein
MKARYASLAHREKVAMPIDPPAADAARVAHLEHRDQRMLGATVASGRPEGAALAPPRGIQLAQPGCPRLAAVAVAVCHPLGGTLAKLGADLATTSSPSAQRPSRPRSRAVGRSANHQQLACYSAAGILGLSATLAVLSLPPGTDGDAAPSRLARCVGDHQLLLAAGAAGDPR